MRPRLALSLSILVLAGIAAQARGAAEFKADRDFIATLLGKLPAAPFGQAGRYRGEVDGFRLIGIDPKAREILVGCRVSGKFDESAVMESLGKSKARAGAPAAPGPAPVPAAPAKVDESGWKAFRFEVQVGVNVEPGPDGTPRFRFDVDQVRRQQLDGLAGRLAKLMGPAFDAIVTSFADKKAEGINDKLNADLTKKMAMFKDYGQLTGVDYGPAGIVLLFDQTRFRSEGIIGHVFASPHRGTVPLYRWVNLKDGTHYYATDLAPLDARVFRFEGESCHVLPGPIPGATHPIHRYRSRAECFYTPSFDRDGLRKVGYRYEGVACFVLNEPGADTVPLYRFVDAGRGTHFYSTTPRADPPRPPSGGVDPEPPPQPTPDTKAKAKARADRPGDGPRPPAAAPR